MFIRHTIVPLLIVASAGAAFAQTWKISDAGQAMVLLDGSGVGAGELSGLTWAGGSQYYAVSDNGARLFPLTIQVDPASGAILSASVSAAIQLAAGTDLEGVAHNAANASVFASDETGAAIREHSLADGRVLQTIGVPAVYAGYRANLSLESLSFQAGQALWTANEEALTADGPVSSFSAGTTVRLQKFDGGLNPAGQWAYVTDPITGDVTGNGRDIEVSGVSDLVALPTGDLLVMERALGGPPFGFRTRIYEVDFTGATDVSSLPVLSGQTFTAVGKKLLWEGSFTVNNFEGIALGPQLLDGTYSLLLVSDDGSNLLQGLYALTAAPPPCAATPLPGCRTPQHSTLSLRRADGLHDKLVWSWRRGTVAGTMAFGDPTPLDGTSYALCIYDTPGGVARLASAARVSPGPEWSATGTTGFRYRDTTGRADGLTRVRLRAGNGTARAILRGKGINLDLPTVTPGDPLLDLGTTVKVQLVNLDDTAECFEATYPSAVKSTAEQFRARF